MFQYSSVSVTLKLPNFDKPQFDENFILEVKVVHSNLNFLHSKCYHPFWNYSSTNFFWVFITVTKQDSSWISSKSRVASSLTHWGGGEHMGVLRTDTFDPSVSYPYQGCNFGWAVKAFQYWSSKQFICLPWYSEKITFLNKTGRLFVHL